MKKLSYIGLTGAFALLLGACGSEGADPKAPTGEADVTAPQNEAAAVPDANSVSKAKADPAPAPSEKPEVTLKPKAAPKDASKPAADTATKEAPKPADPNCAPEHRAAGHC